MKRKNRHRRRAKKRKRKSLGTEKLRYEQPLRENTLALIRPEKKEKEIDQSQSPSQLLSHKQKKKKEGKKRHLAGERPRRKNSGKRKGEVFA